MWNFPVRPPTPRPEPCMPVRPAKLDMFLAELPAAQAVYARAAGFAAKPQELVLLPGQDGIAAAALGLGDDRSPHAFGDLAYRLPPGTWRIAPGDHSADAAVLGFLPGRLSVSRVQAAQARTGAHRNGRREPPRHCTSCGDLDGAGPRQHPGQPAWPGRTGRGHAGSRGTPPRRSASRRGRGTRPRLSGGRRGGPGLVPPARGCRFLLARHAGQPKPVHCWRCAARAWCSTAAATTSSQRTACCV